MRRVIFCIVELLPHPNRQMKTHPEITEDALVSRCYKRIGKLPPHLKMRSPRLSRRFNAALQPLPRVLERLELPGNPGDRVDSFGASHHACLPRIGTTSAPVLPMIAPSRSAHRVNARRFSAS